MKVLKLFTMVITAFLSALISFSHASENINGAGASFPAPLYQAWAYDYNKATGIRVNYQSIGSGGGQRQIVNRTVDFGASDDPLKPEQLKKDNLIQFPTVVGGVVAVVNIPGVKEGELRLDAETLSKIFLGEIKTWNDNRIKALNPKTVLPAKTITVVHRSDGSGTTAIFTNYLAAVSADWKSKVGEGKAVKWPVGIGGKGNEGVANYVRQTPNSIGYVEFAYAKQNKLAFTQLKNRAGSFVTPGFDSFEDAAETGDFDLKKDFHTWLNNTPGKNSWPIAGATFILLAKDKTAQSAKAAKFFEWAFSNGDAKSKELIYVPLPKSLKDRIRLYWKQNSL